MNDLTSAAGVAAGGAAAAPAAASGPGGAAASIPPGAAGAAAQGGAPAGGPASLLSAAPLPGGVAGGVVAKQAGPAANVAAGSMPLTRIEDVKINTPDGLPIDESSTAWLKSAAVAQGMSQAQLDAVVNGYGDFVSEMQKAEYAQSEAALKKEYGLRYGEVKARVDNFCRQLDMATGGAFEPLLQSGLGNDLRFIKTMIYLAETVSPSSMPGAGPAGAVEAMSTSDFISEIFRQSSAR